MLKTFGRPFSLSSSGTHRQFAVALVLVSVIPLLTLWRVNSSHSYPTGNAWTDMATIILSLWVAVLGFILISKYPANITRLRTYLANMAEGEFPEAVSLIQTENDIQSIELSLNVILGRLKERITLVEGEKDEIERQLYQAQKLATLGNLAAGIAHEINAPAQFVANNLFFLEDSVKKLGQALTGKTLRPPAPPLDSPALERECLQAITESMDGLSQVVELGAALKGYMHPGCHQTKREANLNRVVDETLILSRNIWKNIATIRKDYDPGLPSVLCFAGEIRQAVMNLIINATDAIASKGKGRSLANEMITLKTGQGSGTVTISVTDTGTGIPEQARDKIFDRFFTTKEPGKGTGLGLALAYSTVVEKHGGTMSFESVEGQGTTFTITIPMLGSEPASNPIEREAHDEAGDKHFDC
jgi:signal transduction histidine kinase